MLDVRKLLLLLGLCQSPAWASDVEQLIPPDRLEQIKGALPEIAHPELQTIFSSEQTLWYDDEVMTPSYQDSVGASSNHTWPNLVAASEQVISGFWNRQHRRWQFPFSTTAGTDLSTNAKVVNFMYLPHVDGQVVTIPIRKVKRNANRPQWTWVYPTGTVFGEVIFIRDGGNLLPSEIRTRKRFDSGWAMNIFRPFPTALRLAGAVKTHRPDWNSDTKLSALVNFLESSTTLVPKTLAATSIFASTFRQDGWLDPLPDFGDQDLVRQLLTTTTFVSSYDTAWKENGSKVAYAPTATSSLSIVPNNYDAGVIQVTDESCMRCHKETGRLVSEFQFDLYLYGELWGKDGIFSFHPYDESEYSKLRTSGSGVDGYYDNRKINPALSRMGIFRLQESALEEQELSPAIGMAGSSADPDGDPTSDADVTYSQHIKPILDTHCAECHSPGGRRPTLTAFPFETDAGDGDQVAIVNAIVQRVSGQGRVMPPGARPRLTAGEIALIQNWQNGGLKP